MATITVTNKTIGQNLSNITAGDKLQLELGDYHAPVVLNGLHGTRSMPIIVETIPVSSKTRACFSSDISFDDYKEIANRIAQGRQNAGYYPSVGQSADEAMLVLLNCQYVIIRNLDFHGCWPCAIYINNCQQIVVDNVDFKQGTIAIGINGHDTRDLTVQNCCWQQDIFEHNIMWDSIPWVRIHGASDNQEDSSVDIDKDFRLYDGDFIRGWDVAGNITIRNNLIRDAFNGIHFFNSRDKLAPGVNPNVLKFNNGRRASANFLIERNTFIRVLDNCFEPEYHAWNWVIRHNQLMDCYRPFSFEFDRAGWFYVYGNTGAFLNGPSTKVKDIAKEDLRKTMSLFKVKGAQKNEGEIYVFHNSWYYAEGKGLFPKGKLGKLIHFNNAAGYGGSRHHWTFGNEGLTPTALPYDVVQDVKAESKRFTRRWLEFQIQFDHDLIADSAFPNMFRMEGYAVGKNARSGDPKFSQVCSGDNFCALDFKPCADSPLLGNSIAMELNLPGKRKIKTPGNGNIGAIQDSDFYEKFDSEFDFLYQNDWLQDFPNNAELLICNHDGKPERNK